MVPVTIIYSDELLPYCPTVLNLESLLRATGRFDVRIFTYKPKWCPLQLELSNVQYREMPLLLSSLGEKAKKELADVLRSMLKSEDPSLNATEVNARTTNDQFLLKAIDLTLFAKLDWSGIVIAVDAVSAFAASMHDKPFLYLSLELYQNDLILGFIQTSLIAALLIQSEARKNLLFPGLSAPWFLLPNSPVFVERKPPLRFSGDLVFVGTAWELFGFESCLRFVQTFTNLKLTHIGFCPEATQEVIRNSFGSLLEQNKLVLDSKYRAADELLDELSKHRVGLCFYRLDLASQKSRDNYLTAPSGKVANCLAVGLPILCSDLPAFQFVREKRCGVLVSDLSPECLNRALIEIENNYEEMSANAIRVAKEDCFAKHFNAIQEFLIQNEQRLISPNRSKSYPRRAKPLALGLLRIFLKRLPETTLAIVRPTIRHWLQSLGILTVIRKLVGRNPDGTPIKRG